MVEDQARIIETRDTSSPHHKVEVVVFVDNNVPRAVYLDETYTYRVSGMPLHIFLELNLSLDSHERASRVSACEERYADAPVVALECPEIL